MLNYFYRVIGRPGLGDGNGQRGFNDCDRAWFERRRLAGSPAGRPDPAAADPQHVESPTERSIVLLHGPDYEWYRGCTPTAVANLMGFWADRGYPNLMVGGSRGDYAGTIDQLASVMGTSAGGWTWLPINDDIKKYAAQRGPQLQLERDL